MLLDPTMMLSKREWLEIAKMPRWKSDKKYILKGYYKIKHNVLKK